MISFHCGRLNLVYAAVILSLLLQTITLMSYVEFPLLSKVLLALLILPSNILIAYVAWIARINFLEVGRLAAFDGLTGLRNRLNFESLIDLEIARQRRNGGVFSFAFLDIDNLKELNDMQGYVAGDEALKLIADITRDHIRKSDSAARLGGDEFAILMPNTEATGCEQFCRQLSVKIATLMQKAMLPVSTSIGYVTVDRPPGSMSEIFNRAESAMHIAQGGENGGVARG